MARLRNPPSSMHPASTVKSANRQALKDKTSNTRNKAPRNEDDGTIDSLVKDKKAKGGRARKTPQDSEELLMAGGLGVSTADIAPASEAHITTDIQPESDGECIAVARPNRRPPPKVKKIQQSEEQKRIMEGLKQRLEAEAQGQRGQDKPARLATTVAATFSDALGPSKRLSRNAQPAPPERSEFSLSPPSSSPPPVGKLSAAKTRRTSNMPPGSALRTQGTPAIESSILALKNFKRRPRQPSMLQMVQQRTASARPSLANTAGVATDVDDSSDFDLDIGTEDDFAPEAEGTPLQRTRPARLSSAAMSTKQRALIAESAPSRKRKSGVLDGRPNSSLPKQAKRRKSVFSEGENQEQISPDSLIKVAATQSSMAREGTPEPAPTSDVLVLNSPTTSTPQTDAPSQHSQSPGEDDDQIIPSTQREDDGSVHDTIASRDGDSTNGTMADPLSSSPPRMGASQVNHLAYPATQVSPAPAAPKPKRKTKPISTSMLQSLLPKKRAPLRPRHRKSEYDFESDSDEDAALDASHLELDEDELGGRLRRPNRNAKPATGKSSKSTDAKRGRPKKAVSAAKQASQAPSRNTATSGTKRVSKTYGRATTSDKENEEYESPGEEEEEEETTLPEVSLPWEEVAKSKEIEEAKRKFAEIDQWDLQIEMVSEEFHRSSSQEWR